MEPLVGQTDLFGGSPHSAMLNSQAAEQPTELKILKVYVYRTKFIVS